MNKQLSQTIKASMCSYKKQHFIVGWNDIAYGINSSRTKDIRDAYIATMSRFCGKDAYKLGMQAALATYKNLKQSKLFRLDY